MKSENHFLTGVRADLSDYGSNFGKRGGRNLGHCCGFLFYRFDQFCDHRYLTRFLLAAFCSLALLIATSEAF